MECADLLALLYQSGNELPHSKEAPVRKFFDRSNCGLARLLIGVEDGLNVLRRLI